MWCHRFRNVIAGGDYVHLYCAIGIVFFFSSGREKETKSSYKTVNNPDTVEKSSQEAASNPEKEVKSNQNPLAADAGKSYNQVNAN